MWRQIKGYLKCHAAQFSGSLFAILAGALQRGVQCSIDVAPNVFNILNAHGEAQQAFADAEFFFYRRAHAAVRLAEGMVHQAFHAAEAGGHVQQFEIADNGIGSGLTIFL